MTRALRRKFGAHPVMQRVELVLGEKTARDAGLVGEEEHEIAGVVQPPDRLRRIRHPADALPRAHIAVVMVDDAVAVEERGRPQRAGAAHFCGASPIIACSISSQMPWRDGEMDLLDHRRVVARRDEQMIAGGAHGLAFGPGEADGDEPELARLAQRGEDVRRPAGGGEREKHVAALAEPFDLPREHLLKAVVIGDRGQAEVSVVSAIAA